MEEVPLQPELNQDDMTAIEGLLRSTPPGDAGSGQTSETLAGDESTPPSPPEVGVEPPPTPSPTVAPPTELDLGGRKLGVEEAQRLVGFEDLLNERPDLHEKVWAVINAELSGKTAAEPELDFPPPPEGFDVNEPNTRYLATVFGIQTEEFKRQIAELQRQARAHEQSISTQSEAQLRSLVDRAKSSFKATNELSDAETERIYKSAEALVPALVQARVDPITGQGRKAGDVLWAVDAAMNQVMRSIPEYYQRDLERAAAAREALNERKARQTALAGSGGAPAKTAPLPENPRDALIQEATKIMAGNDIQPE
jgi:hypothetical protein